MCQQKVDWALDLPIRDRNMKLVLIQLCDVWRDGNCFPRIERIAARIVVNRRTVERALAKLEACGRITRQRTGRSNRYVINFAARDATAGVASEMGLPEAPIVVSDATHDVVSDTSTGDVLTNLTNLTNTPSLRSGESAHAKRQRQTTRHDRATVGLGQDDGRDPSPAERDRPPGRPPQPDARTLPGPARHGGARRAGHRPPQAPELTLLPALPCDCEVARERWNIVAERLGLPKAQLFSPPRRRALELRLGELGGLAGWDDLLAKLESSSDWFRFQFRPGLDWCLKPANLAKIMEGNYDDNGDRGLGSPSTRPVRSAGGDDAFLEQCYRIARSS
jgi:hypothetical protein